MYCFSDILGAVASVVTVVAVSVTGAREAADAAVVRIATEPSLYHYSTVLELVSAPRRTYEHAEKVVLRLHGAEYGGTQAPNIQ